MPGRPDKPPEIKNCQWMRAWERPEDATSSLYNGPVTRMLKTTGLFLILASLLSAQRASKEAVEQGRKEFEKACGFCHGPDATGARAPDLIRSAVVSHDQNGNLLGPLMRNGRPDKGMPPLPMSDPQVAQITAFLHARAYEA